MKTFFYTLLLVAGTILNGFSQDCHNFWVVVSPDGNYLYFSSDRLGAGYDLYRCNSDGSNLMLISNLEGNDFFPAVSPDGSTIVFQNGNYGTTTEIYKVNNDGTNLTRLTNNDVYDGYPNYSPDGQKIVFAAWDLSPYPEIFIMNSDGSNRTQLTDQAGAYWQSAPKFNPAGDKIYFQAGFNADDHLATIDVNGSNWVDITPVNTFGYTDANLFFNHDGTKIIFMNTDRLGYNNGSDLVVANPDGTGWDYLSNAANGESYYQASFHPSNNLIYLTWMASASGHWNIYSMNPDGTSKIPLSNCSAAGIEDFPQAPYVRIFPSPSSGTLNIEFPATNSECRLRIYNTFGGMVFQQIWSQGKHQGQLQPGQLGDGAYLLEISNGSQIFTKKFVINK